MKAIKYIFNNNLGFPFNIFGIYYELIIAKALTFYLKFKFRVTFFSRNPSLRGHNL